MSLTSYWVKNGLSLFDMPGAANGEFPHEAIEVVLASEHDEQFAALATAQRRVGALEVENHRLNIQLAEAIIETGKAHALNKMTCETIIRIEKAIELKEGEAIIDRFTTLAAESRTLREAWVDLEREIAEAHIEVVRENGGSEFGKGFETGFRNLLIVLQQMKAYLALKQALTNKPGATPRPS